MTKRAALDVLDLPVAALKLRGRARKALEMLGCRTVADVTMVTPPALLRLNYIGQSTLTEVTRALAKHGVALSPPRGAFVLTLVADGDTLDPEQAVAELSRIARRRFGLRVIAAEPVEAKLEDAR
jgi:Bacterial RNA polymerase, alpha chain C terminal domain